MSDKFHINVKQADLDKMASFVRDRIRNLILEHTHVYDHGKLAGMMSDLRSIAFIEPTDAKLVDAPKAKAPTRSEHDAAQQRANAALDRKERERNQAAG